MAGADGVRCMLMRGGTSKGAYFVAGDVPSDADDRDDLLLRIMGSPDARQIDGLGGAHPLTSKVAIVSRSSEPDVDVDYLFLQIGVDEPTVATTQTCGNLLAGVGPFAVERGLVDVKGEHAVIRIRLVNTGDVATATFPLEDGMPQYDGDASIDGVPGTAAPIELESGGIRPLFPTGNVTDVVAGRTVTLTDNGMPVVLVRPEEVGATGAETPDALEADTGVRAAVEEVRRAAGPLMGLGEVADQTVPKVILVSPPAAQGAVSTRAFIPHRVHSSIGVLMAASVAAGICVPGTVAADVARKPEGEPADGLAIDVEHPSGILTSRVRVAADEQGVWHATSASLRTARKIFDGTVFPRPRR